MSVFTNVVEALFLPKRKIGRFTASVTIEEEANDEIVVTENPVQNGSPIADHTYKKPAILNLSVGFNGSLLNLTGSSLVSTAASVASAISPIAAAVLGAQVVPLSLIYKKLLDLQKSGIPFDVVTGKRKYKNMVCKNLWQTTKKESENVLLIRMQLQEIFVVALTTAKVSARKNQSNAGKTDQTEKTGAKNPVNAGQDSALARKSILATAFGR